MKIIQETQNRLFKRRELVFETTYKGPTPTKEEIKKSIAELTKTSQDLIIIGKIAQLYGAQKAKITAKIYSSLEELKKAEVINKKPKKKEEAKK